MKLNTYVHFRVPRKKNIRRVLIPQFSVVFLNFICPGQLFREIHEKRQKLYLQKFISKNGELLNMLYQAKGA